MNKQKLACYVYHKYKYYIMQLSKKNSTIIWWNFCHYHFFTENLTFYAVLST